MKGGQNIAMWCLSDVNGLGLEKHRAASSPIRSSGIEMPRAAFAKRFSAANGGTYPTWCRPACTGVLHYMSDRGAEERRRRAKGSRNEGNPPRFALRQGTSGSTGRKIHPRTWRGEEASESKPVRL